MKLLDEALCYLDMGWCVYPAHGIDFVTGSCTCGDQECPCPGKHPIGSWADFRNKLPSEAEVRNWFDFMDCNIGTVTGMVSGIAVVDVDGEQGKTTLDGLNLEPTLTSHTGGGGFHLFYKLDQPFSTARGRMHGIDIRADGGYVVLPPSLHKSGKFYEWGEPSKLAPFDRELFDRVPISGVSGNSWVGDILQGVPEGNRSISAAKLAGRYFAMGLEFEEVKILMAAWNQKNGPPLPEYELSRTVQAIQRKHQDAMGTQIKTLSDLRALLLEKDKPR